MAQTHKIGKGNTTIKTVNGETIITFHWTEVVKFNDKTITLNSNGWKTNTTKNRMNQTSNQFDLGFIVTQKDFSWYVTFKGETVDFRDGMILKR